MDPNPTTTPATKSNTSSTGCPGRSAAPTHHPRIRLSEVIEFAALPHGGLDHRLRTLHTRSSSKTLQVGVPSRRRSGEALAVLLAGAVLEGRGRVRGADACAPVGASNAAGWVFSTTTVFRKALLWCRTAEAVDPGSFADRGVVDGQRVVQLGAQRGWSCWCCPPTRSLGRRLCLCRPATCCAPMRHGEVNRSAVPDVDACGAQLGVDPTPRASQRAARGKRSTGHPVNSVRAWTGLV